MCSWTEGWIGRMAQKLLFSSTDWCLMTDIECGYPDLSSSWVYETVEITLVSQKWSVFFFIWLVCSRRTHIHTHVTTNLSGITRGWAIIWAPRVIPDSSILHHRTRRNVQPAPTMTLFSLILYLYLSVATSGSVTAIIISTSFVALPIVN